MALWRLDIVGGGFLADGTEVKIVTGVDDHSRFCVIASATLGATGRAVCLAFAAALRRFGVPDEVLTDNGKQFTARFGHGGEVLFDRICRGNGIMHRLTAPASPTTTGKVERFHQTLRRELVADHGPFATIAELQAAQGLLGGGRLPRPPPHQSLGMASPVDRFEPAPAGERELLALRLPATLSAAPAPPAELEAPDEPAPPPVSWSSPSAIEFDRVVPPNHKPVGGGQAGLAGPSQGGGDGPVLGRPRRPPPARGRTRVKSLRSHLSSADLNPLVAAGAQPAGPPPLPAPESGEAVEVNRVVNRAGTVSLAGRVVLAAEILAGRQVSVRIEPATLAFFDPDTRELLRTRPNPSPRPRPCGCEAPGEPGRHHGHRSNPSGCSDGPATPGSSWSPAKRSPSAASTPARSSPSTSPNAL